MAMLLQVWRREGWRHGWRVRTLWNRVFATDRPQRVAVTGLGLVTPLGVGVAENWNGLMECRSAVRNLQEDDFPESHRRFIAELPSQVIAAVPRSALADCLWKPKTVNTPSDGLLSRQGYFKDSRLVLPFVEYAEIAAAEALKDAGLLEVKDLDVTRVGVSIGVGMSGTHEIASTWDTMGEKSTRKISPFFITKILPNMAAGNISVRYGFQGPNLCSSTACAASAHSVGDAFNLIRNGQADVMIAGGSESCLDAVAFAGFSKMKALSTKSNADPSRASCPFDERRDGFVLGEGAGALILESFDHAERRHAHIYAEVSGYGNSGDGHHMTHPEPSGKGASLAMQAALKHGNVTPNDVHYINAHATSTPVGDAIEQLAIKNVFGASVMDHLFISSTKGAIGHLLGAAGAVEAVYTILALYHQRAPPTVNLLHPDTTLSSAHIIKEPITLKGSTIRALSNSFGFGGTNASLLFSSHN